MSGKKRTKVGKTRLADGLRRRATGRSFGSRKPQLHKRQRYEGCGERLNRCLRKGTSGIERLGHEITLMIDEATTAVELDSGIAMVHFEVQEPGAVFAGGTFR